MNPWLKFGPPRDESYTGDLPPELVAAVCARGRVVVALLTALGVKL